MKNIFRRSGGASLAWLLPCLFACSSAQQDSLTTKGGPTPGEESTADGSVQNTDGGSGGDAGAGGDDAASGSDAAGTTNAFTGAAAYNNVAGGSARKGAHNFGGNTPQTNPAKQACLGCHKAGGNAPTFKFGGTVYKDLAGTMPAANVEVRVRDGAGAASVVNSDADGNFYLRNGAFTYPALTGARDGTTTKLMVAQITSGDCNACHNGTTTGFIHVP